MSVGRIFGGGADLVILLRGAYLIYRSLNVRHGFFAYAGGGGEIDRYCGRGDGGATVFAFAGNGAGGSVTSRVGLAFACAGCGAGGVGFSSCTEMTDASAGCGNGGVGVFDTGDTGGVAGREVLDCFASSRCCCLLAMYFARASRF